MAATPSLAPIVSRSLRGSISLGNHPTDERIIDAVVDELCRSDLRRLSLEAVARRAGVSRMTVYRRFASRERLLEATFARETSRLLDGVRTADDPRAMPADRIATAFATAVATVRDHPLAAHWLETEPGQMVEALLSDDAQVLRAGSSFIATSLTSQAPASATRTAEAERIAELLVRLFAAFVLMPPPSIDFDDRDQVESFARELIAPVVALAT